MPLTDVPMIQGKIFWFILDASVVSDATIFTDNSFLIFAGAEVSHSNA